MSSGLGLGETIREAPNRKWQTVSHSRSEPTAELGLAA